MGEDKQKERRFHITYRVETGNLLLREFLHSKGISKRTLTAIKYAGGEITVNSVVQNVRYMLRQGDEVGVTLPQEVPSAGLLPETGPLTKIYEDEALLVLDKPSGQSTIPSRDHPAGTVANFVAGKFKREGIPATVHVATRLDRDTSGLICIAKNRHIHHLLSEQIRNSGFRRQYIAIVHGTVVQEEWTIEAPIGRKDGSIIERIVRQDGQYARTDVTVLKRFQKDGQQYTQVALHLHTGRTHQIRVHMQWSGHPLAGDDLYGGTHEHIQRQALHCTEIQFSHPLTGESLDFQSNMPLDMQKMLSQNL
ncbi:RNA pseudouridine synthase [Sporosarcina sp. HYO08]|nr:RNA pseudouridine synthase [Sporosarcina sp. HYO08]